MQAQALAAQRVAYTISSTFRDSTGQVRIRLEETGPVTTKDISVLHITAIGDAPGFGEALEPFTVTTMTFRPGAGGTEAASGSVADEAPSTSVTDLLSPDSNGKNILTCIDESVRPTNGFDVVIVDASVLARLDRDGIERIMHFATGALHLAGLLLAVPPPYHTGFGVPEHETEEGTNRFSRSKSGVVSACAGLGLECSIDEKPLCLKFSSGYDGRLHRRDFIKAHLGEDLMLHQDNRMLPRTLSVTEIREVLQIALQQDSLTYSAPIISAHRPVSQDSELSKLHHLVFGPDARLARLGILEALTKQPRAHDDDIPNMPNSSLPPSGENSEIKRIIRNYNTERSVIWAKMYAFCNNRHTAEDAVQVAYMRACREVAQGSPKIRHLRNFLLNVGQNYLRDVARRRSSRRDRQGISFDEIMGNPFKRSESRLLESYIRACIDKDRDKRTHGISAFDSPNTKKASLLLLLYGYDMSARAIVQFAKRVFGIEWTEDGVSMSLTRARRAFKEFAEEHHQRELKDLLDP